VDVIKLRLVERVFRRVVISGLYHRHDLIVLNGQGVATQRIRLYHIDAIGDRDLGNAFFPLIFLEVLIEILVDISGDF
jgi:hypothetical protein